MVHIILLILKIAGIVLLSLLGLILLLLAAVLFVPVTYRVQAEKEESVKIRAAVGWMFRILSVRYRLEEGVQDLAICLFGFPIYRPWAEKKDKKQKKRKEKKGKTVQKHRHEPVIESTSEGYAEKMPDPTEIPGSGSQPAPRQKPEPQAEPNGKPAVRTETENSRNRKSVFRKAAYAIRRFCDKIRRIWNACMQIPRKIRSLLDRKEQLLEFWDLEEHRQARSALWKEFIYLRDRIRPRKARGYLHFGFEDPALTGICMGGASVLYAWYPDHFELRPDFEQEILEGQLFFRGRLQLYVLALIALRVWFNKDIRKMYRHWKEL